MSNLKVVGEKREEKTTLHNFKFGELRGLAEQTFSTQKLALRSQILLDGPELEEPDMFGIYKDNGKYLGTVGADYDTIEPLDFLRAIKMGYDTLADKGQSLSLEGAEYNELFGGKVINVKVPIKKFEFDNPIQKGDVTEVYMDFRTGFNGKIATTTSLFFRRCFCDNGCTTIVKGANRKYKHLKNANLQALAFVTGITKALPALQTYEEMMMAMNNIKISKDEANRLFSQITKYDVETYEDEKMHYKAKATYENMWDAINEEFARTGRTAYGLYNGFTNYVNHYVNEGTRLEKEEGYLYKKSNVDLIKNAETVLGEFVGASF